jgi:hypothetical protein
MRITSKSQITIPSEIRERMKDEPFIGMWRDREDMADSSEWVRTTRQLEWVPPLIFPRSHK